MRNWENLKNGCLEQDCSAIELTVMGRLIQGAREKKKSDASWVTGHLKRVNDAGTVSAQAVPESTESIL